ncbi:MAG: hypothetical protein ACRBBR_08810 [Cellvibrionaceae bacterium]
MQSIAYGIKCGNQSCDQYAKLVSLKSNPDTKIIHHYLIDLNLRIPLLANISHIGSPVTTGKNSFQNIYYYGEEHSISVSFYDEALNHDYNLLNESNEIYMIQNGIFTAFLYESANSADHPLGPIFKAIIPVDYGYKKRFITYKTRGLSKIKFINLLSQLKENKQ